MVRILSANWGRTDVNVCGRQSITDCRLNVASAVSTKCDGLNHCSLKASNLSGSDPCNGISKYLEISYVCEEGWFDAMWLPFFAKMAADKDKSANNPLTITQR